MFISEISILATLSDNSVRYQAINILQKWWMCNLGNSMARNMKIRPGRNPYGLVLVQSAQHLQKNVIPSLQCTVTMFHSHPAEVVDEYFGKCDGEKYENAAWEKSL